MSWWIVGIVITCPGGVHESSNISVRSDKDKNDGKEEKKDHEQVLETAEAVDNWQKAGGPVVVAVES